MKKIMFLLLLTIPLFAGDMETYTLTNFTNKTVTGTDSLKSVWIPINNHEYFNLFIDFGTQGDSCDARMEYWIYPSGLSNPTADTTTLGYIREDQTTAISMKTIGTGALANQGRFYFSGQYPATDAISPCFYLQYIVRGDSDHDSLTVQSAELIKYRGSTQP